MSDFEPIIDVAKESVKPVVIAVNGKEYVSQNVYNPPKRSPIDKLEVKSLTGLVDYINQNVDKHDVTNLFIHVKTPVDVILKEQVADKFGNDEDRFSWLFANPKLKQFQFGNWMDQETFIISFQTLFEKYENTDFESVIETVSGIVANQSIDNTDDGLSQDVTVKKGVNSKNVQVKNPVILAPIRTFTELTQPLSPFIFRFKQEGEKIYIALFEADNGKWENEARRRAKEYLAENIEAKIAILA